MSGRIGRPPRPDNDHRIHVGIRYNKYLILLFDRIASQQGLTRSQAVDICLRAAISNKRIPDSYLPEVERMVEEERIKDQGATAPGPVVGLYSGKKKLDGLGSRKRVNTSQPSSSTIK